jgi:hypothetical protein
MHACMHTACSCEHDHCHSSCLLFRARL